MILISKIKQYQTFNDQIRTDRRFAACFNCSCILNWNDQCVSVTHMIGPRESYTLTYCADCWINIAGEDFTIGT